MNTPVPNLVVPGSNARQVVATTSEVAAAAGQLRELALRIQEFTRMQCERLELAIRDLPETDVDQVLCQQSLERLREEQREWEFTRRQQTEKIADDSRRLAEAWEQLEQEQLAVTARGKTPPAAAEFAPQSQPRLRELGEPGEPGEPAEVLAVTAAAQASVIEQVVDEATQAPAYKPTPSNSPQLALMQMQQLRREMRKHGQRLQ